MTRATKLWVVTLIAMACLVLSGRTSSAEWFADVYTGASLTADHDVSIHDRVVGQGTFRDVHSATSLAYGGRFGRYFDAVPFLGLGVDFFNFSPNIPAQSVSRDGCLLVLGCGSGPGSTGRFDIDVIALSLDLMLRLPLIKTSEEPHGVLQPYIAVGAPVFFTTVTPRTTRQFRNHDDETDISFGYKAAGGVAFRIYKNLDLIGEYRYTHTTTDIGLESSLRRTAHFNTELNTHSFLIGLSARW